DCGPAQLRRDVKKGGHIERSEDRRQPDDENYARPHDLPGTDLQIQARKPIASNGYDRKAGRYEITCIDAATEQPANNCQHDDGKNTGWRQNQSRSGRIVAEKRLEQGWESNRVGVERGERKKDDNATNAKIPILQRLEIN